MPGDEVHNHASDRAAILAGVMKKEMFNKVAKQPETKSDDAYRDVITEYEDRFGSEEQVWESDIKGDAGEAHEKNKKQGAWSIAQEQK